MWWGGYFSAAYITSSWIKTYPTLPQKLFTVYLHNNPPKSILPPFTHEALRLSQKNQHWVRICSLALKLLLSPLNLLPESHPSVWAPRSSYSKEYLEVPPGPALQLGGQWASYLDDMSHQQPFQVNTSFTYLGAGDAGWGET